MGDQIMNEINSRELFRQTVKKKIVYIILLGILAGMLLGGIKGLFSDTADRKGDYFFNQTIQVISDVSNDNFNYSGYLSSAVNYYQFVQKAEADGFDFSKLDSAWKRKNQTERLKWLQQNITISSFGSGVFRVSIHFDGNITRDVDYMKEHSDAILSNFVGQSEEYIHKVKPEATFQTLEQEQSYPEVKPLNRQKVMLKFGAFGFVAGLFISSVGFYLYELRKQNLNQMRER